MSLLSGPCLAAELLGLRLSQSDAGERRNRVDAGRHGWHSRACARSLDDIAANDLPFIGGDRRQLRRGPKNVAADMDGRIRGRAQVLVDSMRLHGERGRPRDRACRHWRCARRHSPPGRLRRHARRRHARTSGASVAATARRVHLDAGMHAIPIRPLSARTCATASASSAGQQPRQHFEDGDLARRRGHRHGRIRAR